MSIGYILDELTHMHHFFTKKELCEIIDQELQYFKEHDFTCISIIQYKNDAVCLAPFTASFRFSKPFQMKET